MAGATTSPLAKYKLVRQGSSVGELSLAHFAPCSAATAACTALQVFLGDQSVGKTSIITRFMYDKFDNTYQVGQQLLQWCSRRCNLLQARI